MKGKFAVVGVLAERAAVFGRRSSNACLPALVDKLGDTKVLTDLLNIITQPSLSFYGCFQYYKRNEKNFIRENL